MKVTEGRKERKISVGETWVLGKECEGHMIASGDITNVWKGMLSDGKILAKFLFHVNHLQLIMHKL